MKFKHSLSVLGTNENKKRFVKDLEQVGYTRNNYFYANESDFGELTVVVGGSGNSKEGEWGLTGAIKPDIREFQFNIDSPQEYEKALAIAAIRDDNQSYVGEVWKYSTGSCWKIVKIKRGGNDYIIQPLYDFNSGRNRSKESPTPYAYYRIEECGGGWKKATIEELDIIFGNSQKLTTMEETKKIIQYRVIKKFPNGLGVGVGDLIRPGSHFFASANNYPEFFKPIYEQEEKTITIGSKSDKVTIGKNKIDIERNDFTVPLSAKIGDIESLLKSANPKGTIAGYEITIEENVKFIRIGCVQENHLFSLEDLKLVQKTYNELNK